ncbi:MAG: DUF3368 domain-containing protein [Candidatus Hydrothermarchaeaceae archaeon]
MLVLNASPLIHISRAGYSWVFKKFKRELVIPRRVFNDVVVRGKEKGTPDAIITEKLVDNKAIEVVEVKDKDYLNFIKQLASDFLKPLHEGEAEVMALARERKAIAIIDESSAREVGKVLKIPIRGSIYLLVLLYKRRLISKEGVMEAFEEMVKTGWRVSPRDYELIKKELKKL